MIIVSTHVDDLLLSAPNLTWRKWFEDELEKQFEIVKQYGNLSYLGMNIEYDRSNKKIRVSQSGAVQEIVAKHGLDSLRKYPKTPAQMETLLDAHEDSPKCNKTEFLSLVMSLMYIARLTRPDILMPVTALSTRNADPTDADFANLLRIVRYLAGTTDIGLEFDGNVAVSPAIYADASHNIYPDARGHAGMIITLGSAPILSRSFKIKYVSRSSSETELYALEEATTYSGWLKMLLTELGAEYSEPVPTYQDNKSAIIIASQGGHFKRLKHLLVRDVFVKERIEHGDIMLRYLSTDTMPADMLTKALTAPKLEQNMAFVGVRQIHA